MKNATFILIYIIITTSAHAQVGIGHSVPLWGKTIQTAEASYQYNRFSIHYFHNYSAEMTWIESTKWAQNNRSSSLAFALRIVRYKYVNIGGIASLNRFPTHDATRLNFLVEVNIPIRQFVISYTHISNGFGILHENNLGFDSIKFHIPL